MLFWNMEHKQPAVSYNEFLTSLENNEIAQVSFKGGNITMVDTFDREFVTFSPDVPELLPRLLEKNVIVHGENDRPDPIWNLLSFESFWLYGLGGSSKRRWPRKHDTLLWYAREPGRQWFEAARVPATSRRMRGLTKKAPDWWDIPALNNMAKERLGYPTQKPEALLTRIVESSCPPGGVVADLCCGSGTTAAVAHETGRAWVAGDVSREAVALTRKRLRALGAQFEERSARQVPARRG